jgi:hypothetical protein
MIALKYRAFFVFFVFFAFFTFLRKGLGRNLACLPLQLPHALCQKLRVVIGAQVSLTPSTFHSRSLPS